MRLIFSRSIAAPSRHAPSGTNLYLSYGPEGKEGEGAEQGKKSCFACVANFAQGREETSRPNVLNVLMSWSLLKFSAKTGVLGCFAGLAGHSGLGVGKYPPLSQSLIPHFTVPPTLPKDFTSTPT